MFTWFVRRPQNCEIIRQGPWDKAKKESGNLSSIIGFFGDGQQKKSQYFWFWRQKLVVCSEIPFSKNSYHMETSQLICLANRMTGFYMIQVFTERYFRTDINSKFLIILLSESYLWQWLNMPASWCPGSSVHNCTGKEKSAEWLTLRGLNKPTHRVSQGYISKWGL